MNTHDKIAIRGTFYILLSFFLLVLFIVFTGEVVKTTNIPSYESESSPLTLRFEDEPNSENLRITEEIFEKILSDMTEEQILETYEINPGDYTIMKGPETMLVVKNEKDGTRKVVKAFGYKINEVEPVSSYNSGQSLRD